jgi:hypothetical protein
MLSVLDLYALRANIPADDPRILGRCVAMRLIVVKESLSFNDGVPVREILSNLVDG